MLAEYPASSTLGAARALYFQVNGFGADGGYSDRWVDVKVGPVPVPFPNTAARVRAVRYHDLHHVLTGYRTDIRGEVEIGAWEIAAGCKSFLVAWQLNLYAMGLGLVLCPVRSFRAYARGRRSRSLYGEDLEQLLERNVGELREELGVEAAPRARLSDYLEFGLASLVGGLAGLFFLVAIAPIVPFALVALRAKKKSQLQAAGSA